MTKLLRPTSKIVLLKHKTLKNGEHPVALRVTFNRKPRYYVLKGESKTITSPLKKWDSKQGRYNRNSTGNILLNSYETKAQDVFNKMIDTEFSFTKFEKHYFKSAARVTVDKYFNQIIADLKSNNRLGSAGTYSDTNKRVNEFIKNRKIEFQDMDLGFVQRFEKYLIANGNRTTTIGIYLRTLRATINKAIKEGYMSDEDYPFRNFTIKSGSSKKRALEKESIRKLMAYKTVKASRIERSLSYFIFSYLTRGMNMMDIANLKWSNNVKGNRIEYTRSKTTNTSSAPKLFEIKIEKQIENILNRFDRRTYYVFPILEKGLSESAKRYRIKSTLKRVSTDLTTIAKELKIPEADDITFYWARHTYATVLKRSGVSTAIISEALGHKDEKTTQVYLDKFENDTLDATFDHLL